MPEHPNAINQPPRAGLISRLSQLRNWVSATGLVTMLASLFAFLLLFLIDSFSRTSNPYVGVLTYLVAPMFTTLGLALTVLGFWLARRNLVKTRGKPISMVIDLARPRDRKILGWFLAGSALFMVVTAFGSYHSYQFTESVTFCGQACHTVMEPEMVTYQHGSHARVSCVECHIGPGATWFVKSKLSGLYQVYATALDKYPRPVPTPIKNLRPAQDTCEHCHWPQKFSGNLVRTYRHFLSDETNTEYSVRLLLKVGGGDPSRGPVGGIHWHMSVANRIDYVAEDPLRLKIPWVRLTDGKGVVTEFRSPGFTNAVNEADIRRMDCIDCHNRPAHRYQKPNEAVDLAMYLGKLDRTLPYVRTNATWLLTQPYASKAEALQQIATGLKAAYPSALTVDAAVEAVQAIYRDNFFPEMKANWRAYPEHIGHKDWPGCVRCHDDQ
ncbi:MAG: cytochrome c3 family protein, partial [Limisphaerales bacterium]